MREGRGKQGRAWRLGGEGSDEKVWLVTTVHAVGEGQETWLRNVVGHLSLGTGRKGPSPHAWLMLRSEKLVALMMVLDGACSIPAPTPTNPCACTQAAARSRSW